MTTTKRKTSIVKRKKIIIPQLYQFPLQEGDSNRICFKRAQKVFVSFKTEYAIGIMTYVVEELRKEFDNVYLFNGFPKYILRSVLRGTAAKSKKEIELSLSLHPMYVEKTNARLLALERSFLSTFKISLLNLEEHNGTHSLTYSKVGEHGVVKSTIRMFNTRDDLDAIINDLVKLFFKPF